MTAGHGHELRLEMPLRQPRRDAAPGPACEVREPPRHPLTRTSEARGTGKFMIPVPPFDLKFLTDFAARAVGTSNRRHRARKQGAAVGGTHRGLHAVLRALFDVLHDPFVD